MIRRNWVASIILVIAALTLFSSLSMAQAGSASQSASAASANTKRSFDLLDINSATKDQLDALPGVGPAFSQKIIAGRPYKTKSELVRRNIIPQATYTKIRNRIVARQAPQTP